MWITSTGIADVRFALACQPLSCKLICFDFPCICVALGYQTLRATKRTFISQHSAVYDGTVRVDFNWIRTTALQQSPVGCRTEPVCLPWVLRTTQALIWLHLARAPAAAGNRCVADAIRLRRCSWCHPCNVIASATMQLILLRTETTDIEEGRRYNTYVYIHVGTHTGTERAFVRRLRLLVTWISRRRHPSSPPPDTAATTVAFTVSWGGRCDDC